MPFHLILLAILLTSSLILLKEKQSESPNIPMILIIGNIFFLFPLIILLKVCMIMLHAII